MAMYYYACRLTAACSAGTSSGGGGSTGGGRAISPPPFRQQRCVATISHQPGPSNRILAKIEPTASTVSHQVSPIHQLHPPVHHSSRNASPITTISTNEVETEAMVFVDGNLASARLDALINHLAPSNDYYPDRAFLFAFLLASRLFIRPHELLGKVFNKCQQKDGTDSKKIGDVPSSQLIRLISEWSETMPYDFRDERVMSHLRRIAQSCVSRETGDDDEFVDNGTDEVREEVSLILHNLLDKLTRLEQYEAFLHSICSQAVTSTSDSLPQVEMGELCGSAESLSQQLTHIELERLSYIGPEEFVQSFTKSWNSAVMVTSTEPKITSNYEVYQAWTTRLTRLVVTDVCRHKKNKKNRVRVLQFWIETARECFNAGNFNSLMAIIKGLSSHAVTRLRKTWEKCEASERYSVLEKQMSSGEDFASYKAILKAAAARFNKDDPSLCILIPVFCILEEEIHSICHQCLTLLHNGHVNFEKVWQLAKQVTEFITWKQVHCPFPKIAKVITYLQATPVLNEDAALLASLECEPPVTEEERETQIELLSKVGS